MIETYPILKLIKNLEMFNEVEICKRIVKTFDFNIIDQNNESMEIDFIAERDGVRYGCMVQKFETKNRLKKPADISEKRMNSFTKELKLLDCSQVILISLDKKQSSEFKKVYSNLGGYILDREDLDKIGQVLENKEQSQKDGTFEALYKSLPLVRQEKEDKEDDELFGVLWGGGLSEDSTEDTPVPKDSQKSIEDLFFMPKDENSKPPQDKSVSKDTIDDVFDD